MLFTSAGPRMELQIRGGHFLNINKENTWLDQMSYKCGFLIRSHLELKPQHACYNEKLLLYA